MMALIRRHPGGHPRWQQRVGHLRDGQLELAQRASDGERDRAPADVDVDGVGGFADVWAANLVHPQVLGLRAGERRRQRQV
jgi:hypothetical protein